VPDIQGASLVSAMRVKAVKSLLPITACQLTFELALPILIHVKWTHPLGKPCRDSEEQQHKLFEWYTYITPSLKDPMIKSQKSSKG
jgi:hypothetical protein